ncbi:fatty acid desaturase family protein [Streptomyces sp. NBC_01353]|uniref:fatty acid desaturase family protein n=1 Tax=Streptomyces sp. NBC_01353 TaxID=2903835 RepID=UPI002E31EEFA|nr:acyl-CoA desaturase [Streptomyces sp. NBC_01353]
MPQATATLTAPDRSLLAPDGSSATRRGGGSEFTPLLRIVKEQGLLERRAGWYARGIAVNFLGLAAVVTGLVLLGPSWWALLLAVPLALLSARVAFVGHDAGHSQISGDRRRNRIIQLVHANLLLGMSQEWWNDKHNRHHANPNHLDKDPDVAADILVFAQHQTTGRGGFRGWLTRHQAWLFFPLTTLEGIALKVYGFQALFSKDGPYKTRRERLVEGALLLAHVAGYATLLLTTLTVGQALVFALIHQMLLGLHLGMAFAPNHKGMEMPDAHPDGDSWGHLRRQVLTSRNIRGGILTDWFLGGLNYQIEHHLFPNMPRPHLRLAQPAVRAHCRTVGIPYTETGFVESYRQALGHLHEVGEPLRSAA